MERKILLKKTPPQKKKKIRHFSGILSWQQGDQIGQNFAIWAIFYGVGRIFFLEKVAQ